MGDFKKLPTYKQTHQITELVKHTSTVAVHANVFKFVWSASVIKAVCKTKQNFCSLSEFQLLGLFVSLTPL